MTTDNNEPKKPAIVIPPLPEPLSLTKLHTPQERRDHQAKVEAHYAAKRAAEKAAQDAAQAAIAHANRYLTEDEYFAQSVANENANRARQVEREAARYAEEQQKKEALAASPDIADILTNSPAEMLYQVIAWAARGYTLNTDGPIVMLPPSLWHVQMNAPAKKARPVAKEAA